MKGKVTDLSFLSSFSFSSSSSPSSSSSCASKRAKETQLITSEIISSCSVFCYTLHFFVGVESEQLSFWLTKLRKEARKRVKETCRVDLEHLQVSRKDLKDATHKGEFTRCHLSLKLSLTRTRKGFCFFIFFIQQTHTHTQAASISLTGPRIKMTKK